MALLTFAPLSLFFSAVHTESLCLALSVGSNYTARRGRWKLACALGGLAAATRVTGVGLAIPVGLMYVKERGVDRRLVRGPFSTGAESIMLLTLVAIAVVAFVAAIRRLPVHYGAYALAALLVCTWSPVTGQPLQSFDRYTLTIFPLWMAAGAWLAERRLARPTVLVSAGFLAFWTFQFATWAWVA